MITLFAVKPGDYSATVTTRGRCGVYLDTDMLIEIAKGSEARRDRFVAALRKRGVLLFSEANLAETGALNLAGTTGMRVLDLLKRIGRYWAPIAMNSVEVIEREGRGEFGSQPFSDWMLRGLVQTQLEALDKRGVVLDGLDEDALTATVCDLSEAVRHTLDVTGDQARVKARMDAEIMRALGAAFTAYKTDRAKLDAQMRAMVLDPVGARCTYVFHQLVHILVTEFKERTLGRNDGMDLIHAVIAVSFARIVALDRAWKERVLRIRGIEQLAEVFYRPEADDLVRRVEELVQVDPHAPPTTSGS